MARLSDQLADWLSRVELLARGAERHRVEAVRALAAGRAWEARERAFAILDEMPRSRIGLLLWADAAEATLLDHEVVEALERLGRELPFRADVWYRLAAARHRLGQAPEEDLFRAAELSEPASAADAARLWLADLDRARGDAARAERWLSQLSLAGRRSQAAAWRRLELCLDAGDGRGAREIGASLDPPPTLDARGWLTRARALSLDASAAALHAWTRAILLDAPGLVPALADYVARRAPADVRPRLRGLAAEKGLADEPLLRAAFAVAEGSLSDALGALAEAAAAGTPDLAERYLGLALEVRDAERVKHAAELIRAAGGRVAPEVEALLAALGAADDLARLDALDGAGSSAYAEALRREAFARWLPEDGPARFAEITAELGRLARGAGDFEIWPEIAGVARDVERPLRVAIVGEFNAGKSSLINALLGEDVAPVGVLPTTATLNYLVWAPDRFARIERSDSEADRVVPHAELRRALGEIPPESVRRVSIYAPLELLRKIELTDTPGFNAPDSAHAVTARAAFRDAHVALWLLDATQPLKDSERVVLEEIRAQGLPLVVLLNKLDRLGDDSAELERALGHVRDGLAALGVEPEGPVVALSARLALAGKAGDGDALRRSRFGEVEELVERVLVGRSERLKQRVLTRRCLELAERLLARVERSAAESARAESEKSALSTRVSQVLLALESEREKHLRALSAACERAALEFVADTRRVAAILEDPGARRFVRARARVVLAEALVDATSSSFGFSEAELPVLRRALRPRVQALSAMSAVPLLSAALGEGGRERDQREPEMTDVSRDLAIALFEEAVAAFGDLRTDLEPRAVPPVLARSRSLCAALRARGASFL